jgi:hypothetical protein
MFFSALRDKRAAAVDAIEAWTLWLADKEIDMSVQAAFRCRILREEDPVPADAWCHVSPILGRSVVEHGPFMHDEWGDENEIFRKLRLRAAVAWYLTASEAEQPAAEAMVESLYSSLVERPRIAKAAIADARKKISSAAGKGNAHAESVKQTQVKGRDAAVAKAWGQLHEKPPRYRTSLIAARLGLARGIVERSVKRQNLKQQ